MNKYIIVTATSTFNLMLLVNEKLKEGGQVVGGIQTVYGEGPSSVTDFKRTGATY